MPKKETSHTPDFEKTLSSLEAIVDTLEAGDLSLEDSLTAFEKGVNLTRQCQQALAQAEQRVQILIDKNGTEDVVPFDAQDQP